MQKNLPCSVRFIGQVSWALLVSTGNSKSRVAIPLDAHILLNSFYLGTDLIVKLHPLLYILLHASIMDNLSSLTLDKSRT